MQTIKTLEEAPTLAEFCNKVQAEEKRLNWYEVFAYDLDLHHNGMLAVKSKSLQGSFPISDKAIPGLARLAEIPAPYLKDCDYRLRSVSFNRRLRQKVPAEKHLQLVLKDGILHRLRNTNLLPAPRCLILDTISKAKSENVQKERLKVIKHSWNGQFDVSIIAPNLNCQPRSGDVVAFGVNVSEGRDGAIQIQGAAFRCWCSNGAVNRICDSKKHRLRRPINRPDRQRAFLQKLSFFAHEAWSQSAEQIEALPKLKNVPIDMHGREALRSRLRQAPFFLSVRIINQILQRLEFEVARHQEDASLYDLYNSMTYLGTHTISSFHRRIGHDSVLVPENSPDTSQKFAVPVVS